jgi:alpha-beta hydrolase superfamily lysophospholipase
MKREDLSFSAGNDRCAAWLYRATAPDGHDPIVVMAHGLSGTRRDRLGPFAEAFSEGGFAALVFDHRGFGDSGGEADLFHPRRQRQDWRAAIAFARSLPGIDPERVATFGSSMGGGNALAAAADDSRVAAAISQVPFLDITQAHRAPLRVSVRMMLAAVLGRHLPAVGRPGEPAFINAPGGESGWRRVVAGGEGSLWRNRVSSRWLLSSPFRTSRHAATLHCPWLVCVGEADRVARPGPAIAAAKRAPLGELVVYPGVDHFDIYDGDEHRALVRDQLAFLRRHLCPQSS